jgi:periplasmic protein TonB
MKRALGISLAVHVAVIGSVYGGVGERPSGPPVRVYTVDVVNWPAAARGGGGGRRGGGQTTRAPAPPKPTAPAVTPAEPSSRRGVKVTTAPSKELQAPRGLKKPKGPAAEAAAEPSQGQGAGGGPTGGKGTGKKPAGGGGLGVGQGGGGLRIDGEPFPYPDYLRDLVALIEGQWRPPLGGEGRRATVYFTVESNGTLSASRVETGSASLPFDRSALAAVIDAGPYPALPPGFTGQRLSVHLDFVE